MNKLLLSLAVSVAPQLLGGCIALVRTDPVSLQKYDDISKCARDADAAGEVNTLRTAPLIANCRERFKDVVITAEFDDLSYVPGGVSVPAGSADGPLAVGNGGVSLHLRARADGSLMTCWLDPSQKKDELAELNPGDMLTFKGSFKRRLVGGNRYVTWEYFDFSPCELLSVKRAAASPTTSPPTHYRVTAIAAARERGFGVCMRVGCARGGACQIRACLPSMSFMGTSVFFRLLHA